MKKLTVSALLIAMLATTAGIAYAWYSWCPIFQIDGTRVKVEVFTEQQPAGKIEMTLVVPKDVEASVEPYNEDIFEIEIVHTDREAKGKYIHAEVITLVPDEGERFGVEVHVEVEGGMSRTVKGVSGKPIKVMVLVPNSNHNPGFSDLDDSDGPDDTFDDLDD